MPSAKIAEGAIMREARKQFRGGGIQSPFINSSVREIFRFVKVPVRLFESQSYLTGATAAELRRHLSNMNVLFNR